MNRLKRALLWTALIAILALTVFSIYGAFLGADRAEVFFNSLPLAVYWIALTALLAAGIVVFRRLLSVPSLLLIHLGCILILAGGMWGSKAGHTLQKRLLGVDKIPEGRMAILENSRDNRVRLEDSNDPAELPFFVKLGDFRIDYYEPGKLVILSREGGSWKLPAQRDQRIALDGELGTFTIRRAFKNFKMGNDGEKIDAPGGSNPALEVLVERPDGTSTTRWVFAEFPGHAHPEDPFLLRYQRMPRDYVSELEIVRAGHVVAAKDIEVNHPLHYGGYHFYQSSYGADEFGRPYTVLMVVSDSGLYTVYAGYVLLVAGIAWHFWVRRALRLAKGRRPAETDVPRPIEPHPEERRAHGS
jgi:hypothetical protein